MDPARDKREVSHTHNEVSKVTQDMSVAHHFVTYRAVLQPNGLNETKQHQLIVDDIRILKLQVGPDRDKHDQHRTGTEVKHSNISNISRAETRR